MEKEGLFQSRARGRLKLYRLDPKCPLYSELKQIIFKTEGAEGSLREISNRFPNIGIALIYGSYAKGEEKAASDIDLIVVGKPDRKLFTREVRKLEDKLQREINFNIYTKDEFQKKRGEKGSFLAQVLKGKKIMLKGELDG